MKILVTGGSGYLGTHVRRFFEADDFSRRSGRNLLDPQELGVISDYDVVIHLAAHLDKSPGSAEESFRVNAEGTANVLRHMREGAVFIYASTKDVYGAFADDYAEVPETCRTDYCGQSALEWSKLIGERYVDFYAEEMGLRACIFRMSTVYARPSEGNEPNFVTHYVESVKRGWPIRFPVGGQPVRDILHVDDFSRACQFFIDSSLARGLYNIGGGRRNALSLREITERVGRMIELVPNIDETAHLNAPVPLNYVTDLARIGKDLGWRPQIGIEEGLQSLL
jgi:nucleoside-diphosphate-sugar epimerase